MVSTKSKWQTVREGIHNNLINMFQIMRDQFSETISVSDLEDMKRLNQYNPIHKNDDSTQDVQVTDGDSLKQI